MSFAGGEGRGFGASAPPRTAEQTDDAAPRRQVRLRPLLAMWPFAARYRGHIVAACAALAVASLATLAVPVAVRRMIDFGFSAERIGLIDQYFAVMIAVVALLAAASALRYYFVTVIGERVVADLREAVFTHLTQLSPVFFDSARTGELTSRLTADTTQIKSAVGTSVSVALRNLLLFVGSAAMMVVTSPRLSAFVLGAIPVIVLPLVAFGRMVRRRSRFAAAVERAFLAARYSTRARAVLTAVIIFLVFASVVVILWVGAQDVMAERMSAGTLGQFVLYAVFAAGALGELSQVWGEISQAAGAAERLTELLAIEPAIARPAQPVLLPSPARGEVGFEAVRFAYPTRPETNVLDGVTFRVKPGEKVAIVGPSGAGKSTLFHLLLRFYDPTGGVITFDGVDLTATDPTDLRRHIALVPQDAVIFAASAADNIRFGRADATDDEVRRAAELALADEFIRKLPQDYDTQLGERGVTLSGGQRQRIAIARAILREAPLLLLDEATSSLDAESERLVQTALEHLMQDRTTLVIAHRLATVLSCDRILVMDQGRISEQGRHDDLVASGGLYARLAKLQFEIA